MRVNEVVVGRKFNLGNFESLEIRVCVSPEPDDSHDWDKIIQNITTLLNEEISKAAKKLQTTK